MKLTIEELVSRGKKVYVVDMSEKPDKAAFRNVSEIPFDADYAVIGLTKTNPAEIIEAQRERNQKMLDPLEDGDS